MLVDFKVCFAAMLLSPSYVFEPDVHNHDRLPTSDKARQCSCTRPCVYLSGSHPGTSKVSQSLEPAQRYLQTKGRTGSLVTGHHDVLIQHS